MTPSRENLARFLRLRRLYDLTLALLGYLADEVEQTPIADMLPSHREHLRLVYEAAVDLQARADATRAELAADPDGALLLPHCPHPAPGLGGGLTP